MRSKLAKPASTNDLCAIHWAGHFKLTTARIVHSYMPRVFLGTLLVDNGSGLVNVERKKRATCLLTGKCITYKMVYGHTYGEAIHYRLYRSSLTSLGNALYILPSRVTAHMLCSAKSDHDPYSKELYSIATTETNLRQAVCLARQSNWRGDVVGSLRTCGCDRLFDPFCMWLRACYSSTILLIPTLTTRRQPPLRKSPLPNGP